MSERYYDTTQICPHRHVASEMAASYPDLLQAFCEECGEATIMQCSNCNTSIRGHYHVPGVIGGYHYDPPGFCFNCGEAFPWTKRKQQAALDLFFEETQNDEDRQIFQESIE